MYVRRICKYTPIYIQENKYLCMRNALYILTRDNPYLSAIRNVRCRELGRVAMTMVVAMGLAMDMLMAR